MKRVITFFTCMSFTMFTIGCYTLETVTLAEGQSFPGRVLQRTTMTDGHIVKYQDEEIDSLAISKTSVIGYSNGMILSTIPLDSVKSIQVRSISWFGTLSAMILIPAAVGLLAMHMISGSVRSAED
ncbi:MAG TPA: hypothetical protein VK141_03770 [Nitrosomonas sp.]|nr:hypothetical protein [Nitrosomonas sp.]